MKVYPSQQLLHTLLEYRDGHLYNKTRRGVKAMIGKRADYVSPKEPHVSLNAVRYIASRIIYIMHHGDIPKGYEIDHRDCNPQNNHIENLRLATHRDNQYNKTKYRNNKSGYKGVVWYPYTQKWNARIVVNGRRFSLGYYQCIEHAAAAYAEAAAHYHGEYARY